ncbi:uncharacterized protein MYCFIDRAFT_171595 [Pseudocercospora fijiensis CIRAD86]|uniref:Fungal N-terminal domain-containing protein n=1 Tax=Pseudocercospora fijiensis (strain CIRAD86) TaxID=383855 RepID=M3A3P8_PSEFD|nr:uncharacterized protein MYCFIDRAFT_171595 [Pseudocercospora fijiensis CIRAD86]EME85714.1 hypothetical protein MYCFIDRAFT_171595 [Pseudocercospora fijiensis CIRAD86]
MKHDFGVHVATLSNPGTTCGLPLEAIEAQCRILHGILKVLRPSYAFMTLSTWQKAATICSSHTMTRYPLSRTTEQYGPVEHYRWTELRSFHDGVSTIDSKLEGLLKVVDGLRLVLESVRDTFVTVTAEYGTGHVGSHWRNIARSLKDGQGVLGQLQEKLQSVNKTGKHLDAIRKQLRMNFATEQIAHFQQQIQSYRDTLQLSVQAVILWNQVPYQKSVESFVPALSDLQKEIRRLALEMNRRIDSPQPDSSVQNNSKTLTHLRECVRSAASVIYSASSVRSSRKDSIRKPLSDFGDCFPVENNVALQRWMASEAILEIGESESEQDYDPFRESAGKEEVSGNLDLSKHDSVFQNPNANTAVDVQGSETDANYETEAKKTGPANELQTTRQRPALVESDDESDAPSVSESLDSVPAPLVIASGDEYRGSGDSILQAASEINNETGRSHEAHPKIAELPGFGNRSDGHEPPSVATVL